MTTQIISGVQTTTLPDGKLIQHFPKGDIRVVVRDGMKGIRVFPLGYERPLRSYVVPVEIASLAAGKDAWMRQVLVKCSCGTRCHVGEMECGICPACYEQAGIENEIADGLRTA